MVAIFAKSGKFIYKVDKSFVNTITLHQPSLMSDSLRYPIGTFTAPEQVSENERQQYIVELAQLPQRIAEAVEELSDMQLNTPYRDGGWTVRQVVHHLPDSHLNAYARFRLALTEDNPTIRPYREDQWAELGDAKRARIEPSLQLLTSLHQRWVMLLQSLTDEDFARTFVHPQHDATFRLDVALANYAWHGHHHLAHITTLKERKGW